MNTTSSRYSTVAICLHWLVAAAILSNVALGIWMHEAIDDDAAKLHAIQGYQLHKSLGFTILALSLLRGVWRLLHKPPPFPATMTNRQVNAARWVHGLFYGLMIAVPLSGWLLVSTQWRGEAALNLDTLLFDRINVPHLFALNELADSQRQHTAALMVNAHAILAISMAVLALLHIGAALLHQFRDRDQLLRRMSFALGSRDAGRLQGWIGVVITGLAVVALASYAITALQLNQPSSATQLATPDAIRSSPTGWRVLPEQSVIGFSGEHAGRAFTGRFERWHIDAQLNPQDLTASRSGVVTIELDSAYTGDSLYDRTLPEPEWFNIEQYPTARFQMHQIQRLPTGDYSMQGALHLKDQVLPVSGLQLTRNASEVRVFGEITIQREAANLGMESDAEGAWVSLEINVSVDVMLKTR